MKTVKQLADEAGISVRTLHYYDEIGLLSPARYTQAGYRLYGKEQIQRLQQILFLRELDFSLSDIGSMLQTSPTHLAEQLKKQQMLLTQKHNRLGEIIRLMEQLIQGEDSMSLTPFNQKDWEQTKQQYKEEVQQRWGHTKAYKQSERRAKHKDTCDYEQAQQDMDALTQTFAERMELGAAHPDVQQTVARWQKHITRHHYDCTDEILSDLGEMYSTDDRFQEYFDRVEEGLAHFVSKAIAIFTKE